MGRSVAAEPALRDAMRFKLHYAQGVLEGIATENFPLIATNAQKLAQLARSSDWQARATPDYERFTADFLRQTDALARAAKKQSVDAATVAYFQLTVSCVNCHRHLRGVEPAKFRLPAAKPPVLVHPSGSPGAVVPGGASAAQFRRRIPQTTDGSNSTFR